MSKHTGLILAALVLAGAPAGAQESSRRAMAGELIGLMNVRANIEKSLAMAREMIPAQMEKARQAGGQPGSPADSAAEAAEMMKVMSEELSWEKLEQDYVNLYAETFTEEEMKGLIAFYKSPAGQAFVKKQPELMKRSMELSQKLMLQIMPKIQALTGKSQAAAPSAPSTQPQEQAPATE